MFGVPRTVCPPPCPALERRGECGAPWASPLETNVREERTGGTGPRSRLMTEVTGQGSSTLLMAIPRGGDRPHVTGPLGRSSAFTLGLLTRGRGGRLASRRRVQPENGPGEGHRTSDPQRHGQSAQEDKSVQKAGLLTFSHVPCVSCLQTHCGLRGRAPGSSCPGSPSAPGLFSNEGRPILCV